MEELSLERLELALQASNEGIWDWELSDSGPGDLYFSERALKMMSVSKNEAPHFFNNPQDSIHEEDLQCFVSALAAVLADHGENRFVDDCRFLKPNGEKVWLRIRGIAVRNDKGEVTRVAGSMIDISVRKNLERERIEERHGMMTLLESIPVNVFFKDLESKFVMVNSATARRFGLESAEDLIGKSDHDFFDDAIADAFQEEEKAIIDGGELVKDSLKREGEEEDGGEQRWSVVSRFPWTNTKGKVMGIVGISSDVTNMVNTQNQLVNMTYQLTSQKEEMEKELQLAYEVQLAMIEKDQLKAFPKKEKAVNLGWSVNFAYRYNPVSSMAGDFYHIVEIDENRVGVFICDVMGHGVRSALIVSMLRGLMEKERGSAGEPDVYLREVNEGLVSILKKAGVTMFATALYGVIDIEEETFQFTNAGHPCPIVISSSVVKNADSSSIHVGPALGLVANSQYQINGVKFEDFSKLLLFTDGLLEAENLEGEEMGVERICNAIKPQESLEQTLDDVIIATKSFSNDNGFNDDVCMLGINLVKI